jgi:hypothetical protein
MKGGQNKISTQACVFLQSFSRALGVAFTCSLWAVYYIFKAQFLKRHWSYNWVSLRELSGSQGPLAWSLWNSVFHSSGSSGSQNKCYWQNKSVRRRFEFYRQVRTVPVKSLESRSKQKSVKQIKCILYS